MNGNEAEGDLILIQTLLLLLCQSSCSYANYLEKAERSVSKQGHLQPRLHSWQGCSQDFSKGGSHWVIQRVLTRLSPEYCGLSAYKKAYKGGVTGTPGPPLATPLHGQVTKHTTVKWPIENTDSDLKCTRCIMQMSYLHASDFPFKNFCKIAQHTETIRKQCLAKE